MNAFNSIKIKFNLSITIDHQLSSEVCETSVNAPDLIENRLESVWDDVIEEIDAINKRVAKITERYSKEEVAKLFS